MDSNWEDDPQVKGEATFEVDLSSGRVVGRNQKETGEVIAQKIYDFLTEPRSRVVEELTQELSTDNYLKSYLLVEKAYEAGEFFFNQEESLLEKINEIKTVDLSDE